MLAKMSNAPGACWCHPDRGPGPRGFLVRPGAAARAVLSCHPLKPGHNCYMLPDPVFRNGVVSDTEVGHGLLLRVHSSAGFEGSS